MKVGDRAILDTWGVPIPVIVVEDRGHIGVGGRRLVRIRFVDDETREFEVPAEFLEIDVSALSQSEEP